MCIVHQKENKRIESQSAMSAWELRSFIANHFGGIEAFGNCVTGLSFQDAEVIRILTEKQLSTIEKKRILKDVKIPKDSFGVSWNTAKDKLHEKISELPEITSGEWELFRDGIGTKQSTDFHIVTLCKYENREG